jgi:hypothetical protein
MDEQSEEQALVRRLFLLTGREDRLGRQPDLGPAQETGIKALWPALKIAQGEGITSESRCDLLNRLLLTLGIKTASHLFYKTVFGEADLSDFGCFDKCVERFRQLCMLEYGSFRFGYKQFSRSDLIQEKWRQYFPSLQETNEKANLLKNRPPPIGITPIQQGELFALGYLASKQAPKVNQARILFGQMLSAAVKGGAKHYADLQRIAKESGINNPETAIVESGIPGAEALVLPLFRQGKSYEEAVLHLRDTCSVIGNPAILAAQERGLRNAHSYMTMHNLDVYVATSMRDPLHFTTNWSFVQKLFHEGELKDWHLYYFDPTQAFLPDRIQKGLLENLMIKRARLTVYNAQEADTFGKDAEAGVTLAQRKPVIIFVARLFDWLPADSDLKQMYAAIDQGARLDRRDDFVDLLVSQKFLNSDEAMELRSPDKTRSDAVGAVVERHASSAIKSLSRDQIIGELVSQGYDPLRAPDPIQFASEKTALLERRALTFRAIHPLSLQTSPLDGVARGVIVTRSVGDTARVVKAILLGNLEYEIESDAANWLLTERITRSPIRVVTKDSTLTAAFWSEKWGAS